jgi:hypothetical protein
MQTGAEYDVLDARCAPLTESEHKIGDFETRAQESG